MAKGIRCTLATVHYVIGKQFTRKRVYLQRLFLDSISHSGAAYFDFTGSVDWLLASIPPRRWDDVILFTLDAEFPVGLNILNSPDKWNAPDVVLQSVKNAWASDIPTPNIDLYVYGAIAGLVDVPDATLLNMIRLMDTEALDVARGRKRLVQHAKDAIVKDFWENVYENKSDRQRYDQTQSTLSRFYLLALDPDIRNIIGQVKTSFALTETSIVIASFPPRLGREKSAFLSSLLLWYLPDFLVILDNGVHLTPQILESKMNIVFAHDYMGQLKPALRETLLGTADTITVFRIGPSDERYFEGQFDVNRDQDRPALLPPYKYHERTADSVHMRIGQVCPPADFPVFSAAKLHRRSRQKNGTPRAVVEARIAKFLENT